MEGEFNEEDSGGWIAPSKIAIDSIVTYLKLSGGWSRDGRSLRSLNRYWRHIITSHVTHLHPRPDRVIEEEDLDSLTKFSGVKSIDLTAFLCQDRERVEKFYLHKKSPTTARFLKLLENLQQLPRLQELKLKDASTGARWFERQNKDVRIAIAELRGISRLILESNSYLHYNTEDISIFSSLPIQEISGWITETASLSPVDLFPSLKKAWIKLVPSDSSRPPRKVRRKSKRKPKYASRDYLSNLESLRLETSDPMDFDYLPDKRTLEGVRAKIELYRDLVNLADLNHLKHLSLDCLYGQTGHPSSEFTSGVLLCISQTFHELKSLELQLHDSLVSPETWNSLFERLSGLKSLSLAHAHLERAAILNYLQNLEILKLIRCNILDSDRSFDFTGDQDSLEWKTLQNIRELEIHPLVPHKRILEDCWSSRGLFYMSRLERLVYQSPEFLSLDSLTELILYPNLRYLELECETEWRTYYGQDVFLYLGSLDVIKIKLFGLKLSDMEVLKKAVVEVKAANPWISLHLTVSPIKIECRSAKELDESLEKVREVIDEAKTASLKLLGAEFTVRIPIGSMESFAAFSKAADKFSLLKNFPDWMSISATVCIRSSKWHKMPLLEEVRAVFDRIKSLCPLKFSGLCTAVLP